MGRTPCALTLTLLLCAVLQIQWTSAPVFAQTPTPDIQVFVGYADNSRPRPDNFPTPWSGSPNVVFEGCSSNCSFDAGAVMLFNNTPATVTINSVEIDMDTCALNLWPRDMSLSSGQNLIVTQTAGGGTAGCIGAMAGQMDTSDIGPGGVSYAGNCNPNGIIPVVKVTIDGNTSVLLDKGQVLNTGGFDKGGCPNGTNESIQWTLVGGLACPGAVLSLAASSDAESGDSTPTVQATLANNCETPLPNAKVDFSVLSGPNAGFKGSATTDSSGRANFTYQSSAAGTDLLQAAVTNPAGTFTSNNLSLQVGRPGEGSSILLPLLVAAALVVVAVAGGTVVWRLRAIGTPSGADFRSASRREQASIFAGTTPGVAPVIDAWLEVVSPATAARHPLGGDPVTIGFTGDCTIDLSSNLSRDDSRAAGRARIWKREGRYMLHNLGAMQTPVIVNGRPVVWVVLEDGDQIQMGPCRLLFTSNESAA